MLVAVALVATSEVIVVVASVALLVTTRLVVVAFVAEKLVTLGSDVTYRLPSTERFVVDALPSVV
jgi:hypothetical protein